MDDVQNFTCQNLDLQRTNILAELMEYTELKKRATDKGHNVKVLSL